jgi:glycosyltransferase involved in cell wall biosynthesis
MLCQIDLFRYYFAMLSVCILTKNASATLRATLDSVRSFPEVLILDNGSTDETCAIAAAYPNVRVVTSPFIGFGPLRNQAAELASNNWILSLDSDEVLSPLLLQEILNLSLNKETAYVFPRHNYYNGKRIRGCGWDPEHIARLYQRSEARFTDAQVHEELIAKHYTKLQFPLLHTPYRSTVDFLSKMQHYSTLFAEQYRGKRKSSFRKALLHAIYAFIRSYFLKRGMFCGSEGFTISLYNANTTFYKYMKLAELNKRDKC